MKFRFSEKLKYMVLGSLLTLAGFMFGNMNSDTEAQLGSETMDTLTVRELIVVEDIKITSNSGSPRVMISSDRNGGKVTVFGPGGIGGKGAASLSLTENGGRVSVFGIGGEAAAMLAVTKKGGTLTTKGVIGEAAGVGIGANEEGGTVTVFDREGKPRAAFGIDNGEGFAYLVNRFGEIRVLEP